MEIIPSIISTSGFESKLVNHLHNSSFISRILFEIQQISHIYSVCTLGAIIFALFATFPRFKLVIFKRVTSNHSFKPVYDVDDSDFDSDEEDEEEDDDDPSCSSSRTSLSEEKNRDEDFDTDYNTFTWSEIDSGKRVVKLWPEGIGLGLRLELGDSNKTHFPIWDLSSSSSMVSPSVIISAGIESGKNAALRVWDTRVGRHIPEIFAEWKPHWESLVGNGDSGEVFSVDVRDIRNVKFPVDGLTESDILNKNLRWISSSYL